MTARPAPARREASARLREIHAAVLRQRGGPFRIERLDLEGPRDDEVLVRIAASGICHTDITYCDHWEDADGPLVLGHEGAGIVEQAGGLVSGLKSGDHVVLSYQSCGACSECRRGRPAHCRRFYEANFGFQRLDGSNALQPGGIRGHFFGQSSMATFAVVTERNAVRVAPNLPLQLLAPLGCGLQTGAGTVLNSLRISAGQSMAVFGARAVGLAAVMAAAMVRAMPIVAVDIRRARLKLALELGASHAIDSRHGDVDVSTALKRITGGGVDYVLETTGDPQMERLAREVLNPRGITAMIANPAGGERLPGGRRIVGIVQGDAVPQDFIPRLIQAWKAGRFPFERLVKFYSFRSINRAVGDARQGRTIKPVLLMPGPPGG